MIINLLIQELNEHETCFVKYKQNGKIYEKQFSLISYDGESITLNDVVFDVKISIKRENIISFTKHLSDDSETTRQKHKKIEEELKLKIKRDFGEISNNIHLSDILHETNIVDTIQKDDWYYNVKIMNLLKIKDIDEYKKLINNDQELIKKFKDEWKRIICLKLSEVISELANEENTTSDINIKEELQAIKNILNMIPNEVELELKQLKTFSEIKNYWPILLLPCSF